MKKFLALVGLIFILGLVFLVIIESLIIFFFYGDRFATKSDKIGIIRLEGAIINSEEVIRIFKRYESRSDIKGFVLRIESPGGSVAAVQEIYEELLNQERKGKRIVASMANVAASGGYYVALASQKIYANPGTLTGSIGVIINVINFQDLMQNWGIELKSITSGPYKDTGSLARKMTPEEEALLKELVNNVHNQFVQAVRERRRLPEEALKNLTDGRILTGSQAYEAGLVDQLGGLEAAVQELAKMCGLKGKPKVIELKGKGLSSILESCSRILGKAFSPMGKPGAVNLKYSL